MGAKTLEELRNFNKKRKNQYTFDSGDNYIDYGSTVSESYIKRLAGNNEPVGIPRQASPARGSEARDLTPEQRIKLSRLSGLGGRLSTFELPAAPYAALKPFEMKKQSDPWANMNTTAPAEGSNVTEEYTDKFMSQYPKDTSPDDYTFRGITSDKAEQYDKAKKTDAEKGTSYADKIISEEKARIAQGITDKKQKNLDAARAAYMNANVLQDPVLIEKTYKELKIAEDAFKQADTVSKTEKQNIRTLDKENKTAEFTYENITKAKKDPEYNTVAEKGKAADEGFVYTGFDDMNKVQNKVRYYENHRQQIIDDLNMSGAINMFERWDYLYEEEKSAYDYMIGAGEYEKADQFLKGLDSTLQYRQEKQVGSDIAKKEGVDKYLTTFTYGVAGGIGDSIGNILTPAHIALGRDITENTNTTGMQDAIVEAEDNGMRLMMGFGQSFGNMVIPYVVGGSMGKGLMFLSSAGGAYREAKSSGADEMECITYALLSGASETGLQSALGGISRLGGNSKISSVISEGVRRAASKVSNQKLLTVLAGTGNFVGDMGSEAFEEYLQSIITPALQNSILDADNKITLAGPEQIEAAVTGALFAGVFNGISAVSSKASNTDLSSDNEDGSNMLPEQNNTAVSEENSGAIEVGKVTKINNPYYGSVPEVVNSNNSVVEISNEAVQDAQNKIEESRKSKDSSFRSVLTKALEKIFFPENSNPIKIKVSDVTYGNSDYIVTFNKGVIGKLVSDPNISAEKLAVLYNVEDIIEQGQYVGSGNYMPKNNKKKQTIRFDYFESDVSINSKPYVVSFDVEVFPFENQYRTHKIYEINNIDLIAVSRPDTGPVPAVRRNASSLTNNIPQINSNINTLPENSIENISTEIPEFKTGIDSDNQAVEAANGIGYIDEEAPVSGLVTPFTARDLTNEAAKQSYIDGFIDKLSEALNIKKSSLLNSKSGLLTGLVEEMGTLDNISNEEMLSLANKFAEGISFSSSRQYESAVRNIYGDIGVLYRQLKNVARISNNETAKRSAMLKAGQLSAQEMDELYTVQNRLERELGRVQRKNKLTTDGKAVLKDILAGRRTIESVEGFVEAPQIKANYAAETALREAKQKIQNYNISKKAKRYQRAAELTKTASSWRDKKTGLGYSSETLERNFEDITKDKGLAKQLEDEYVTPIKVSNAAITRRTNEITSQIKGLKISEKANYEFANFYQHLVDFYFEKGNYKTKSLLEKEIANYYGVDNLSQLGSRMLSEAELIQLYGEGIINDRVLEQLGAKPERIKECVEVFRNIYGQLYSEVNRTYISNGYEPMGYIENYFPHYRKETASGLFNKFMRETIGIDGDFSAEFGTLPTDIAGTTDTFKPGRKFNEHALKRKGDITSFNCLEGMQSYLNTALQVIYQTENIQNLRALEGQLRYMYSDDGIKARIAEVNNNTDLDETQRQKELEGIYMESDSQLSNLVQEIRRYTNRLAGKKSDDDRSFEYLLSRPMYKVMNKLSGNTAGNMIGGNFGTALTNLAPLTLAAGEVRTDYLLRGVTDTARRAVKDDGLMQRSNFYTARKGSETLTKNPAEKISGALSKPMEFTDLFTVEAVFRGRYYQNTAKGMDDAQAIADADKYCSRIFADRNKNVMPTMFHATNPFMKLVTMFQLEVNNQLRYVSKDIVRAADKNKGLLVWQLIKILASSWLVNKAKEKLTGYGGLFDPVGIIEDAIYDFSDEKTSTGQAIYNLVNNIADQLPFVSALSGGGRVPVLSVLPEGEDLPSTIDSLKALISGNGNAKQVKEIIANAVIPSAYIANPYGGIGQLKKTIQGVSTVAQGGEIGYNAQGEPYYKYVVDNDTFSSKIGNYLQAGVFGKSSLSEAQDYYDGKTDKLTSEQTAALQRLKKIGAGTYEVSQVMQTVNDTKESRDSEGNITDSKAENVLNYVMGTELSQNEKEEVILSSNVLSDKTVEDLSVAEKEYKIPAKTFYEVYLAKLEAEPEKDALGKTVTNSESAYIRRAIDDVPGLSDEQRRYLYEISGVNKTIANASNVELQMLYNKMRQQKKEAERLKSVGFSN